MNKSEKIIKQKIKVKFTFLIRIVQKKGIREKMEEIDLKELFNIFWSKKVQILLVVIILLRNQHVQDILDKE